MSVQTQIQIMSRLPCAEEVRPKLRAELHEKMTTLVEFLAFKVQSPQPTTPVSLSQNSAESNLASPEKRSRTTAAFPEYTGLSPSKCRVVEAENVDSKFTPLDKVGSTYKIRHNVLGKVLMVGKVVQLKVGPNKDRLLPKFSYILGSKTGTVEVTAMGQIVQRCFDQVHALKGQVASLSNAVFEKIWHAQPWHKLTDTGHAWL